MSDIYMLKYNGMKLTYSGLNGYISWEDAVRLFHVNVIQSTGGTITATPIEGPNGTVVTLTNEPDADYRFGSYTVTGATLDTDQFTINDSDADVTGTFNKYREVWVNLGSTEYQQATQGTKDVTLTGMQSSSSFNYLSFVFDAKYTSGSMAADIFFIDASNSAMWRGRYHYNMSGKPGFVGITHNVTGWTTQSGQSITSKTVDGVSYRLSDKFLQNAYTKLKFVFDRTNKRCYVYANGTLLGYATMNADMINCRKIRLQREQSSGTYPMIKNVRVAAFSTLADAQAYNG